MLAHGAGLFSRSTSRCQRAILLGSRLSRVAPSAGLFNALGLSSVPMDRAEESAFMRAQFAALTIAARAEREAAQAQFEASQAQNAALVDAANRNSVLTGLQLLIARSHDVAVSAAMQPFPGCSPTAGTPTWFPQTTLFANLSSKVPFASQIAEDIVAAISMAKCTEAPPGCSERPSKKNPSADSVHTHVKPVVAAVASVLTSGKWTVSGSEEAQPRNVAFLYEQGYNDNPRSAISDFSAARGRGEGTPAQLTGEAQVGIVECKKKAEQVISTPTLRGGEIQTAAYVAQSLYPAIACGANLEALVARPLSAYGVYTNSSTSTLVEVRITGSTVEVYYSRMPFLPGGTLPGGAVDTDASPMAFGAVAFGLGVMAMLGDPRLCASASAAYIQDISPRPEGVELPALAPFLGRGKFARVFRLNDTVAIKVPVSSLTPMASWTAAIDAEARALTRLGACRPPCCHVPELVARAALSGVRGALSDARTPTIAPLVAQPAITGASSILLRVTSADSVAIGASAVNSARPVQGLLTTPICTMLPEALESLRRRIPLGERTVEMLQFLSLSVALPLLAAQAHARSTGLSHYDAHTMNVGLADWNADAAVAQLKGFASRQCDKPRIEPASFASSSATLHSVDSFASTGGAAMCRRVILNDWGSARTTGVAGFSKKHAVAVDTAQVATLSGHLLRHMLDFLPDDDLVDSASEGVASWLAQTLPRLSRISSELQGPGAVLAEGVASQLCLLRALGLVSNTVDAAGATMTLSAGDNTPIYIAATADSADIASVEAFCSAATAATGCSCYSSGFVLRPFNAPPIVAHVTCSDESNDAQLADTTGTSALLGTVGRGLVIASTDKAGSIATLGAIATLATSSFPAEELELEAMSDDGSKALAVSTVVVLVSNIASFLSERVLRAMLAEFGVVIACMLLPPEASTKPGRRALIQFADAAVAARLVGGLTNFEVGGQLLAVAAAPVALAARYIVTANSDSHAA